MPADTLSEQGPQWKELGLTSCKQPKTRDFLFTYRLQKMFFGPG